MLQIKIPAGELWDQKNQEFILTKECTICLEHSLVSLSKWESKWHKPFLNSKQQTKEETIDYIRCMTITQNVDPNVYMAIGNDILEKVNEYIKDSMTATTFHESENRRSSNEIITSELIYYWMVSANIPFECQKWHLNRLLTLIKVCGLKNQTPKKMPKIEIYKRNRVLNEARRKKYNTRG